MKYYTVKCQYLPTYKSNFGGAVKVENQISFRECVTARLKGPKRCFKSFPELSTLSGSSEGTLA